MESVLNVNVTKYKSVKDRSNPMEVNLWEVLSDKTPSKTIDKLRELMPRTPQNELERQTVKNQLEAITVNANYFNGAAKQDNPNYKETGLMFIDIDGKDNLHIKCMEKLKADLSKIANIAYIELSCSGDGLHVLMPVLTPKDLSAHYEAVNDHFKRLGIVVDKQVKGITRLKYLSKDPSAFVRHDAIPYAAILNSDDRQSQEQFNDSLERYGKKSLSTISHKRDSKGYAYTASEIIDRYNALDEWIGILASREITLGSENSERIFLKRNGSSNFQSGSFSKSKRLIKMWTANTELEPEKAYTPYVLLRDIVHGGNKKAAFEEMKAMLGIDHLE